MVLPRTPRPPFETWPVQIADERFGFAWYCGAGIIVTQSALTHGTQESAHAYHDYADRVLLDHADDLAKAGGLYVIHDLRILQTYDQTARRAWTERMKRRKNGYLRGSTVVVREATPLLKMAVSGINLMAALNLGSTIELTTDLIATLRKHDVQPPGRPSMVPRSSRSPRSAPPVSMVVPPLSKLGRR